MKISLPKEMLCTSYSYTCSEVLLFISASDETKAGDMPVVRKIMAKAGGEVTLDSKGTVVIVDDSGMSRKFCVIFLKKPVTLY